jgi:hypothetical protein
MAFFGILKHHGLATLPAERPVTRTEDRGDPGDTYPSLDAFYAAGGERRTLSIEHDFGVMWREGTRKRPRYRLSWIEATGELYTLALSEFEHQRKVELLGIVDTREQVEQLLMGWEALPFGESTLDWVRERIVNA